MPNYYVTLFKLTDQGIREIKNAPQRIAANTKALEAAGGKMIGLYATMGEYDYVSVVEGGTDEDAMTMMLGMGSRRICQDDHAQGVQHGTVCTDGEEAALAFPTGRRNDTEPSRRKEAEGPTVRALRYFKVASLTQLWSLSEFV